MEENLEVVYFWTMDKSISGHVLSTIHLGTEPKEKMKFLSFFCFFC